MRCPFSLAICVVSLFVATIACAWGWETLIKNRLYNCTDDFPLDYLQPGHWVHQPVAVQHVAVARSMSEPDTIEKGWSVPGLWLLWCSFVGGSVILSLLVARLPWGRRERVYEHANATDGMSTT